MNIERRLHRLETGRGRLDNAPPGATVVIPYGATQAEEDRLVAATEAAAGYRAGERTTIVMAVI